VNLPEIEKKILEFWKKNKIFEKSLEKKSPKGNFVFYEGPPTANGKPGIHHLLARAFKDLIPRYKTMQGYYVARKAGWDTHGLPVELEVEKELGLKNKKDVEDYGIEKFNEQCKKSIWKYKGEWEKMTERIGFWIDLENPYVTYENNYIESLWWIIKQIHEKGLLYKGHKVIPQCPRCGTALSSHEVAQGYKNIKEDSVYIKFRVKNKKNEYILAWTTTPWTLPGNIALAVGENIDYSIIEIKSDNKKENYIIATDLTNKVFNVQLWDKNGHFQNQVTGSPRGKQTEYKLIKRIKGKDLIGLEYEPLFPGVIKGNEENAENAFKVYGADFVSTEDGTGVVHTAVMYGQDDYELGEKIGLPKVHTVNLDGTFNELISKWQGKFVKDVESEIIEDLKKRNLLYKTEEYAHDYPFCWRCDTPLIYYAKDSWFFKVSDLRDNLIKNNSEINWIPQHIKEGRFGEWLRDVKDWAISRERYWGTSIPVWICENCGEIKVIGSRKEIGVDENFDLHRPFVDKIELDCQCGGKMKRTPEVMDCWFDSGAMPFAQLHYPFENRDLIDKGMQYPADFIAEAIDQTRGWFYTLLAISTLLDKGISYKNVICLGHILDKKGQKMSKHVGNVVDPWQMIEQYGVDAIRWYFYTINSPGEPKKFNEQGLKESSRIFITFLNVVNFYRMFSSLKDENKLEASLGEKDLKNILDRWIVSKLNLLIKNTTELLDNYDITTATRGLEEFINDLSVWYLRRSRDRLKAEDNEDRAKALKTLRWVILNTAKLLAPFTPFVTEYIYKEMGTGKQSVHLENWPDTESKFIEKELEEKMEEVRKICSLALQKRVEAGIPIRQPLQQLTINNKRLTEDFVDLIKAEVNVKEVVFGKTIELNTKLTQELKEEGMIREFIRQVQALRKKQGLIPKDKIRVYYSLSSVALAKEDEKVFKKIIEKNKEEITKQVIAEEIIFDKEFKIEKV